MASGKYGEIQLFCMARYEVPITHICLCRVGLVMNHMRRWLANIGREVVELHLCENLGEFWDSDEICLAAGTKIVSTYLYLAARIPHGGFATKHCHCLIKRFSLVVPRKTHLLHSLISNLKYILSGYLLFSIGILPTSNRWTRFLSGTRRTRSSWVRNASRFSCRL